MFDINKDLKLCTLFYAILFSFNSCGRHSVFNLSQNLLRNANFADKNIPFFCKRPFYLVEKLFRLRVYIEFDDQQTAYTQPYFLLINNQLWSSRGQFTATYNYIKYYKNHSSGEIEYVCNFVFNGHL